MKLQTLLIGLALAAAGSAFAGASHTRDVTVTRDTPNGTVTKHIVRTQRSEDFERGHRHMQRVVVVNPHHRHHAKKVVIVHPAEHGRFVSNRTVVIHHNG